MHRKENRTAEDIVTDNIAAENTMIKNTMAEKPAAKSGGGDKDLAAVAEKYAVAITDDVRATMQRADHTDPIGKQYLPSTEELVTQKVERIDPIGDEAHAPVPGIVHRHPDRVLLKPVQVCAVYCRFCFRREKVGPGKEMLNPAALEKAIDYIRGAPRVWEVIITGGDPLVMSPRRLGKMMAMLNDIPHVEAIRFHTRVPVADPGRVTDDLIAALKSDKAVQIVYHSNHAHELTDKVKAAAEKFIAAGIPLFCQSVLLRGVNDKAETLERLFRKLITFKIKPYYLHHPDLAPGTSHFRLSLTEGQAIYHQLRRRLSGIALPGYVLDIPGGFGKVPVTAEFVMPRRDGSYTVTDPMGGTHHYQDPACRKTPEAAQKKQA